MQDLHSYYPPIEMNPANRRIRPHWSGLDAVYRILDAASVAVGLAWAVEFTGHGADERTFSAGAAAIAIYLLVAEFCGVYRNWRGASAEREMLCVLFSWCVTLAALVTLGFAAGYTKEFPRRVVLAWLLATPLLVVGIRIAIRGTLRLMRSRGLNTRSCAIVGVTELGIQLARNIDNSPEMGLRLVGFYDDRPEVRTPDLPRDVGHRIGNFTELFAQTRAGAIDIVYLTIPMRAEERLQSLLARLGDTTASVYIVPDFFVFEMLHSRWTNVGGLPAVSVFEHPFLGVDGVAKRVSDLVIGGLLLVLLAPLLAFVALLVKLSSPGPVFFRQRRYGLDGREIRVWKFRSMRVCEDGDVVRQAQKNDSRVTPIGAVLRRTSLDELPQLFNVVGGSMSLVGPRPHAAAHNEQYRSIIQGYMLRHKVKPGITGLAQVSGWRGETDTLEKMEGRVQCDHRYIRDWSLWLDVKILLKTVLVVFSRQNAY